MKYQIKFYLLLLMCVGIFFTTQSNILASEADAKLEGIAYDRYTMEYIGELENIKVHESDSKVDIIFNFNGKSFDLQLNEHPNKESHNLSVRTFSNEKHISDRRTVYNGMKSDKGFFGEIVFPDTSISHKGNKEEFAYLITDKKIDLKGILSDVSNKENVKERIVNNKLSLKAIQQADDLIMSRSSSSSAYVHATGPSIPFLISSGMAEGWATIQYPPGGSLRTITNLHYNIVYNWPSDGVSLWYDSMNNDLLYNSPAWPSSGVQSVNGSWVVDITKGDLVAQATTTALVKGVPVGYSNYDVDDLK
jgi:hypothetical protein